MAVTTAKIVDFKYIENTSTSQFTAESTTLIDAVVVTNVTSGTVFLGVNLVPSGGATGNDNAAIIAKNIRAGESYLCPEIVGQVLMSGDFITAVAGASSSLNIKISGRLIT